MMREVENGKDQEDMKYPQVWKRSSRIGLGLTTPTPPLASPFGLTASTSLMMLLAAPVGDPLTCSYGAEQRGLGNVSKRLLLRARAASVKPLHMSETLQTGNFAKSRSVPSRQPTSFLAGDARLGEFEFELSDWACQCTSFHIGALDSEKYKIIAPLRGVLVIPPLSTQRNSIPDYYAVPDFIKFI